MTNERGSRKFIEDAEEPTLSAPSETSFDFDEVNGNWEEVRRFLDEQAARGATDLDALSRSIDANSHAAQVMLFGGPVQLPESDADRGTTSPATRGGTVARAFWWGFHIQVSHEDVQVITSALDGAAMLISALGDNCPAAIRPFLPVVRVFLDVSRAVLQALDRGNGVYISMSWFAPGVFVPTSV